MEELQDVYFKTMRTELIRQADKQNVSVTVFKRSQGIEMIPQDINGFIAVGSFNNKEITYLETLTENGVFLDSSPYSDIYDAVRPDLDYITRKAVRFFKEKGHKEIGFVGGTYVNQIPIWTKWIYGNDLSAMRCNNRICWMKRTSISAGDSHWKPGTS